MEAEMLGYQCCGRVEVLHGEEMVGEESGSNPEGPSPLLKINEKSSCQAEPGGSHPEAYPYGR